MRGRRLGACSCGPSGTLFLNLEGTEGLPEEFSHQTLIGQPMPRRRRLEVSVQILVEAKSNELLGCALETYDHIRRPLNPVSGVMLIPKTQFLLFALKVRQLARAWLEHR